MAGPKFFVSILVVAVVVLTYLHFFRDDCSYGTTDPMKMSTGIRIAKDDKVAADAAVMYNNETLRRIRSLAIHPSPGGRKIAARATWDLSQNGQSAYVDEFLRKKTGGVFVECGAADGIRYSNSLFLEVERNWTGVLIEAEPREKEKLAKINRNAIVISACLSTNRTAEKLRFWRNYFRSMVPSANRRNDDPNSVIVDCFPLNSIMAALNISHVDYFSLDVEGSDLGVLETIDWSRLTIDVIGIEFLAVPHSDRNHTFSNLRALQKYFYTAAGGVYRELGTVIGPKGFEWPGLDVFFTRLAP